MHHLAQVDIGASYNPPLTQLTQIGPFTGNIAQNVLVIASVVLLFLLIAGGLGMILGAGSGDSDQAGNGRKAATAAVIGFVIIFAAYWIVQIIEKITGVPILS